MSITVDPAFANVGKKEGLEAWRIESLKPVRVADDKAHLLHSGDSYIFLKTSQEKSGLKWSIHFWLGKDTSTDEAGTAAIKAVELDDALGGVPVQYRECQGYESPLFLSYFKKTGLQYLEGGVASGFKEVKRDEYETRLFQVKGTRTVRVTQVPVQSASLTVDDVYVLDCGLQIFVYNGKNANRMEKAKGLDFAGKLKSAERGGRATITFLEDEPENETFWKALGGYTDITRVGGSDEAHEEHAKRSTKVFKVTDESGNITTEDVTPAGGVLDKSVLKSEDVFLVNVGSALFIWIGKGASNGERKNSMSIAMKCLEKFGQPLHTPITRVVEGAEPAVFTSLFKSWTAPKLLEFGRQPSVGIASASQRKLDVNLLVSALQTSEDDIGTDPTQAGHHEVKVWRIEDMKKVEVPDHLYGQFFGGDSYIVLHSVTPPSGKPSHVIYFWQGRSSTTDEKASSALLAMNLDDEMGGTPVQVRVVQGKEPAHFRTLFKGRMIVHSGGKASGFTNVDDADSYDTDGVSLFHIKGTKPENTVAAQVDEKAANLNSGDCFVLETPTTVYEWHGNASSPAERGIANSTAEILAKGRPCVVLEEGSEPEEFWSFLGGKAPYPSQKTTFECPHQPRLFHCSNSYGFFNAEELCDFAQDDLNVDDVFLLDTYTSLYVWIGSGANEEEKREVMKLADEYLATVKSDGRGEGTPVITVHCGNEPPMFTCNFLAWDPKFLEKNDFKDPYAARLAKLKQEKEKNQPKDAIGTITSESIRNLDVAPPAPVVQAGAGQTFTLEQLKAGVEGIDLTSKENYLSDAEFEQVMGMNKDAFSKLPKWRQQAKKKEVHLF